MRIDNVEFSADLQEILNELVMQLRANDIPYIQKMVPTTTDVQICCPYHKGGMERSPSAGIRRSDGLFHCFACGEVHSLAEVISHCFGKDSTGFFGWNWLLKNFASVALENRKPLKLNYTRSTIDVTQQVTFVPEEELDRYRYYHPYWSKRKIEHNWILDLFDLGYDRETDCITMPNRDINGNCLFVARRSVKTKYFNYPPKVKKPVYGLFEIKKMMENRESWYDKYNFNEIIICESMIDALTCFEYDRLAVALNGLGTPEQFEELRKFPCRKYIIATDMDARGLDARKRIKKELYGKIVTEYVWDLNIAKDINDMEEAYFKALPEYF